MDRLIYIAMTGAKHVLYSQAVTTNNIANATTDGFKSQISAFRALPVYGEGSPTRSFVVESTPGNDYSPGAIMSTGRQMDVAIRGKGWIAVQDASGKEAYTRNGSLQTDVNGVLQINGMNVLGDGGPISVPPDNEVAIAKDGTISTIPVNGVRTSVNVIGRLKLVNPPEGDLVRGEDGLFRQANGQPAAVDEKVQVASGSLEASNVNMAEAMVNMITDARQYDMQLRLIQRADENARSAAQVISIS